MNKSQLKTTWGQYVDTDKMVDDIMALLTTYKHRNTEHGVCTMLNTFFINKEPLIQKFISSPHYVGNLRICLRQEFARSNNANEVSRFCSYFESNVGSNDIILSRMDEHGKTMTDYMMTGAKIVDVKKLHDKTFVKQLNSARGNMNGFDDAGYTKKSRQAAQKFHAIIYNGFSRFTRPSLDSSVVKTIHDHDSSLKLAIGLKTSRAFNRVCEAYGVTKAENYNKLFAQYADLVSDLKKELDFYISLNPYDYLTMSFGNSWASCHTIDKMNIRNMPTSYSGGYCGGTLSYMLDKTSIITFVVDKDVDVQQSGKIYRNMFHFGSNMLMQSRVYPQSNDGGNDLYKSFRDIVQAEFALMLGLANNSWDHLGNRDECNKRVTSDGVHYPDYIYRDDCNISCPTELRNKVRANGRMKVGHTGICSYCGREIDSSSRICHDSCYI
jgi:hypothetical protein